MATRPWLGDLKTRGKPGKTREERLVGSIVGGHGEAEEDADHRCWLKLVFWAIQQKPGKFAQLAVPAEHAGEIARIVEGAGMVTRIGDSLTAEFRVLTMWEPPALTALCQGAVV